MFIKALMKQWGLLLLACPAAVTSIDIPSLEIKPGVFMPILSIGTGGLEGSAAFNITRDWLALGGRGIDAAKVYFNQKIVANAIAHSGINRKDLFITTKIPGCFLTEHFVEEDLKELGTDYIDLLLLHAPIPIASHCPAAWKVLEDYYHKGVLRAIGISNFKRKDIEHLMKTAKVVPAVNQILHNILEHDDDTIAAASENNITIEAYSPLGRSGHTGDISTNSVISSIADNHKVSVYQVALKWIVQHGHVATFQSSKTAHQQSDADIFAFNLTESEMAKLDTLGSSGAELIV